jgi:hypothetical protein
MEQLFCYDCWLVLFLKFLILAFHAWWTILYDKVIGVGIHPVWKQDVYCALVSKLKIGHAMWCVCWSVTCVFVPFPALKGLILWMGMSLSFLNYAMQTKQIWMHPEKIYKKYLKSRMSQTLDWLPFCSECLSVRWPAWLPYFGKIFDFF